MMELNERQLEIVRVLRRLERVSVADLSLRFHVSPVTIRKDLDELERREILQRTHGGAISAERVASTRRIRERSIRGADLKKAIARRAFEMVFDVQTVALDAGSTTIEIARMLMNTDLCVVTNSLLIADELSERDSGSVVMLGGMWRKESECFMGPLTLSALERVNIDIAFIGAAGITSAGGFNSHNTIEAQTKEHILKRAARRFIVADSSKYGQRAFSTFCNIGDVDGLIIDDGLTSAARESLTQMGLEIITAPISGGHGKR